MQLAHISRIDLIVTAVIPTTGISPLKVQVEKAWSLDVSILQVTPKRIIDKKNMICFIIILEKEFDQMY